MRELTCLFDRGVLPGARLIGSPRLHKSKAVFRRESQHLFGSQP
jgi:hypothetical protein